MKTLMLSTMCAMFLMTGCDVKISGWDFDTGNPYGDITYSDPKWPDDPGCYHPDTTAPAPTYPALTAAIWANKEFVVVGNKILRSLDGESFSLSSWNPADLTRDSLTDIAWFSGRFIAVGPPNRIFASPDGATWEKIRVTADSVIHLRRIACSDNGCVAIGGTYGNSILLYSPDGITWNSIERFPCTWFRDIIWDGSRFMISTDSFGVDWTTQSAGIILTSTDGQRWKSRRTGRSIGYDCLRWSDNRYLAVGQDSSIWGFDVMTSSDGLTWTKVAAVANPVHSITSNGTTVVAAYYAGGLARITNDGTVTNLSFTNLRIRDVIYGNGVFVAVTVGLIATSPDGETWTAKWQWSD